MFSALSHEASPEQCLATSTTRSKTEGLKEGSACMSQYGEIQDTSGGVSSMKTGQG